MHQTHFIQPTGHTYVDGTKADHREEGQQRRFFAAPFAASTLMMEHRAASGGNEGRGIMNNVSEVSWSALAKATCIANLGTLLFGFDLGITSWIILEFVKRGGSPYYASKVPAGVDNYYEIVSESDFLKGVISSISTYGAAMTYYILMFYGNEISKRSEMQLAAILYFIGSLLCTIALNITDWYGVQGELALGLLLSGLLIFGSGFAATFHSVPQYLTELCPRKLRGRIGASVELSIVTGVVLGQLCGYQFCDGSNDSPTGWSNIFKTSLVLSALYGILVTYIPMEIDFMLRNDGLSNLQGDTVQFTRSEILTAVQFLYPRANDNTLHEFELRLIKVKEEEEKWQKIYNIHLEEEKPPPPLVNTTKSSDTYLKSFKTWVWNNTRLEVKILLIDEVMQRVLLVGFCLKFAELACGLTPLLWDLGEVFLVLSPDTAGRYLLGLSAVKAVAAGIMVPLMDVLPRRTWLGIGQGIMIISLVLAVFFTQIGWNVASIWCIYGAYAGWEIGYGTIVWIILNEIFPKFVRSAANSIIVGNMKILGAISITLVPAMVSNFDVKGTLIFFTIFTIIGSIFCYLFIAETRGVDMMNGHKLVHERYEHAMGILCCRDSSTVKIRKQNSSIFLDHDMDDSTVISDYDTNQDNDDNNGMYNSNAVDDDFGQLVPTEITPLTARR